MPQNKYTDILTIDSPGCAQVHGVCRQQTDPAARVLYSLHSGKRSHGDLGCIAAGAVLMAVRLVWNDHCQTLSGQKRMTQCTNPLESLGQNTADALAWASLEAR
ncbi:hypothetical protein WJX77_000032 [Trebouxia sp. C0004]